MKRKPQYKLTNYSVLALPFSEDRLKLSNRIIENYLTPVQIKRLKVFTRILQADMKPSDVKTMLVGLKNMNLFLNTHCAFVFYEKKK